MSDTMQHKGKELSRTHYSIIYTAIKNAWVADEDVTFVGLEGGEEHLKYMGDEKRRLFMVKVYEPLANGGYDCGPMYMDKERTTVFLGEKYNHRMEFI